MDHYGLGDDFPGHPAFDFDIFRSDRPETVNLSFAIHHYVSTAYAARNFARIIDSRRIIAMKIAAQPAFD